MSLTNLQLGLFEGQRRQAAGVKRVASNNAEWLERMRRRARSIAQRNGAVTADDLRAIADRADDHPTHPNAWGAIFKGHGWELVGYRKSTTPSAHARRVGVWRLK